MRIENNKINWKEADIFKMVDGGSFKSELCFYELFQEKGTVMYKSSLLNIKETVEYITNKFKDIYIDCFKVIGKYKYVTFIFPDFIIDLKEAYDEVTIHCINPESTIIKDITNYLKEEVKTKNTIIKYIIKNGSSLNLKSITLPPREINIFENYDDCLNSHNELLINNLAKTQSGIYLLYGIPGTGKSNFIRYLKTQITKDFIFVPISIAQDIDSPELINLLIDNPDSVLIIEDCEKLLVSREKEKNSAITALLNLSDGLIGQSLGIQIICTFNTKLQNIDSALLRKGRLIQAIEFDKLSLEKTQNLFKKFGYTEEIDREMTLTDIYNFKQENFTFEKKVEIGFNKKV